MLQGARPAGVCKTPRWKGGLEGARWALRGGCGCRSRLLPRDGRRTLLEAIKPRRLNFQVLYTQGGEPQNPRSPSTGEEQLRDSSQVSQRESSSLKIYIHFKPGL